MNDLREALRAALEALDRARGGALNAGDAIAEARETLELAIGGAQPEPVKVPNTFNSSAPSYEPDGMLHDDGCFTWRPGKLPSDRFNHAGWRRSFYLCPPRSYTPMKDAQLRTFSLNWFADRIGAGDVFYDGQHEAVSLGDVSEFGRAIERAVLAKLGMGDTK